MQLQKARFKSIIFEDAINIPGMSHCQLSSITNEALLPLMHHSRLLCDLLSYTGLSNSVGQENRAALLHKALHLSHADLNSIRMAA